METPCWRRRRFNIPVRIGDHRSNDRVWRSAGFTFEIGRPEAPGGTLLNVGAQPWRGLTNVLPRLNIRGLAWVAEFCLIVCVLSGILRRCATAMVVLVRFACDALGRLWFSLFTRGGGPTPSPTLCPKEKTLQGPRTSVPSASTPEKWAKRFRVSFHRTSKTHTVMECPPKVIEGEQTSSSTSRPRRAKYIGGGGRPLGANGVTRLSLVSLRLSTHLDGPARG